MVAKYYNLRANTDREGRYRFAYLKLGYYEVTVRPQGFADVVRAANLTVGSALELPVSLAVGEAATNVVVNDEAAVLETARTQIAGTVSQTEFKSMPLNGGNFLDLALLSSHDGAQFEPSRKIGAGTWPLNACPMDGGGLIVEGGHVMTAWRDT